jgi:hypothetical protein
VKFAAVQNLLGTAGASTEGTRTTHGEYQPREAVALHMMYQHRLAGNRPPDKDGALAAQFRLFQAGGRVFDNAHDLERVARPDGAGRPRASGGAPMRERGGP